MPGSSNEKFFVTTQSPAAQKSAASSGGTSSSSAGSPVPYAYVVESTCVTSSAFASDASSTYTSPTSGEARKMIPGLSPSRPALKEPSLLTSSGRLGSSPSNTSKSTVSSPKYHESPLLAGAYQSSVASARKPSRETWSRATMQCTPAISFVSFTISTTSVSLPARYSQRLPTVRGKYGFGFVGFFGSSKRLGSIAGS